MFRAVKLLILMVFSGLAAAQTVPSVVLLHGKVWTENPRQPEAEAVALAGEKIIAVGSDRQIAKLIRKQTQIIDLHGRRVLPGFNDAHTHFIDAADALTSVHLQDAKTPEEFRSRIAAFAKTVPTGEWITHGNWTTESWPHPEQLNHALIDDVTPQNPVAVWSVDGHSVLANSLALQRAGIGPLTKDVAGGVIVRDASGKPTGVLRDAATGLIMRAMGMMTETQMNRAIAAGNRYASEHGVTSVQTLAGYVMDDRQVYFYHSLKKAEQEGRLQVRVSVFPFLFNQEKEAAALMQHSSGLVRVAGVKAFADGSMGSHTAWLSQPYIDEPQNRGMPGVELENRAEMLKEIEEADAAGLIVAVHAIGDAANHAVLELFEQAEKANPKAPHRFRMEHAQLLAPEDISRLARLHIIASMQPDHYAESKNWAVKRLGVDRANHLYEWQSLLHDDVTLAFGSDWPVAPMDPLLGIYVAATRVGPERISVVQAVHAYTMGSAIAEDQQSVKGSIEPGKLADLIVLSDDIFHEDPSLIAKTRVEMTIFNGKVVYQR